MTPAKAAALRALHVREFMRAVMESYSGVDDDGADESLCDALVREQGKVERAAAGVSEDDE